MKTTRNKTTYTTFQLCKFNFAVQAIYTYVIPGGPQAYLVRGVPIPKTINYCGVSVPVINMSRAFSANETISISEISLLMVETIISDQYTTLCFVIDKLIYTNQFIDSKQILPPMPVIQDIDQYALLGTIKIKNNLFILLNIEKLRNGFVKNESQRIFHFSINENLN